MRETGREAVIVEAVRTPVARGHMERGNYREAHPADLLGRCYLEVLARAGVDAGVVDNVFIGCAHQVAEQSTGIARTAWLQKGLPSATGATTIDVRCGSGQQAVNLGALTVAAGVNDVVVAGGVEHMGRVGFPVNEGAQEQWGRAFSKELLDRYDLVSQGISAELIADRWQITRNEMDEFALRSHRRAQQATTERKFEREILPIEIDGETYRIDQGIRSDTSLEALAALKPAFKDQGKITAGNSSQVSAGAATLLLTTPDKAAELGIRPRARIVDQVVVGVDPVLMLTGPIPATAKILARNELNIDDIDVFEINEAFASVVLAWGSEHRVDMDRVNRRGGAIAIGHPLGSTGARLLTTLLHVLEDEDKELGLVAMCCGGGLGTATLMQRL